jgi:NAD(P)-dependent dehydrogenase (short-subunit alcohol dehydrogenase family)
LRKVVADYHLSESEMNIARVAAVFGAGPGNGAAFAARLLKEGYNVAVLSRNAESMVKLAASLGPTDKVRGYPCDVGSDDAVQSALAAIQSEMGSVSCVVYNAGSGSFKPLEEWTAAEITTNTNINAAGLFRVATAVKPQLLECVGKDWSANIVVIGASAATRGRPGTVGFAAGKAAQRSVAQSLARAWGPEKIHISYVVIDGLVGTDQVRSAFSSKPEDFFLQPAEIANTIVNIVNQKPSAWTFEYDLRPYGETW